MACSHTPPSQSDRSLDVNGGTRNFQDFCHQLQYCHTFIAKYSKSTANHRDWQYSRWSSQNSRWSSQNHLPSCLTVRLVKFIDTAHILSRRACFFESKNSSSDRILPQLPRASSIKYHYWLYVLSDSARKVTLDSQ